MQMKNINISEGFFNGASEKPKKIIADEIAIDSAMDDFETMDQDAAEQSVKNYLKHYDDTLVKAEAAACAKDIDKMLFDYMTDSLYYVIGQFFDLQKQSGKTQKFLDWDDTEIYGNNSDFYDIFYNEVDKHFKKFINDFFADNPEQTIKWAKKEISHHTYSAKPQLWFTPGENEVVMQYEDMLNDRYYELHLTIDMLAKILNNNTITED